MENLLEQISNCWLDLGILVPTKTNDCRSNKWLVVQPEGVIVMACSLLSILHLMRVVFGLALGLGLVRMHGNLRVSYAILRHGGQSSKKKRVMVCRLYC